MSSVTFASLLLWRANEKKEKKSTLRASGPVPLPVLIKERRHTVEISLCSGEFTTKRARFSLHLVNFIGTVGRLNKGTIIVSPHGP